MTDLPALKIDDNIQPPEPNKRGNISPIGAALGTVAVGQSFFVPGKTGAQMGGYLLPHRKRGKRFVTRTAPEPHPTTGEPVNGVRVWRIA